MTPAPNVAELHRRLLARLAAAGTPGEVLAAFERVQRHVFLPRRLPDRDGVVDRQADPHRWYEIAYTDAAIITQTDEGAPRGRGRASSSSSAPSVMAAMLHAAGLAPGMRVLEVGTGTGYNAALLCELAGAHERVVTVEIDPALADRARVALAQAGYAPHVLTGDGEHGAGAHAPFDRVIATCTVGRVPTAWIHQTRPGGLILTPWSPSPGHPAGFLARLVVHEGWAQGAFVGGTSFMWSRTQRGEDGPPHDLGAEPDQVLRVEPDPRGLLLDNANAWVLYLAVPDWRFGMRTSASAEPFVWLSATDGPSWARIHPDRIEQAGPRRLWDEIQTAYRWWNEMGRPTRDRFGLTVTPDGTHQIWIDEPDHVLSD